MQNVCLKNVKIVSLFIKKYPNKTESNRVMKCHEVGESLGRNHNNML